MSYFGAHLVLVYSESEYQHLKSKKKTKKNKKTSTFEYFSL